MFKQARAAWRHARTFRSIRPVMEAVDRVWWARTIRRADVVDLDYVIAQGGPRTVRGAVRRYVRGGFRDGFALNPLFMEKLVSSQLADAGRVPALYAYLVGDTRTVTVGVNWDAVRHAQREPEALTAPGGPLGHGWRAAVSRGSIALGTGDATARTVPWAVVGTAAASSVSEPRPLLVAPTHRLVFLTRLAADEGIPARPLEEAIAVAAQQDAGVVIAVAGHSAESWTAGMLMSLWIEGAQTVVDDDEIVETVASIAPEEATLVVRGPHAEISADALLDLAATATDRAVAPLWLGWDGAIASAGSVLHDGVASALLAGHPVEDASGWPRIIEVAGLDSMTFARPARSDRSDGFFTRTDLRVRAPAGSLPPGSRRDAAETDIAALLTPLGFEIRSWDGGTAPILARTGDRTTVVDGISLPALRWALKIAAPPGRPGEAWGDTHFARGLAEALRRLGQQVVIDAYDARERPSIYLDDVSLALRGPEPFRAQRGATSLLWIISHPDEIDSTALRGFDQVFAASAEWAREASSQFSAEITPLLQCTDAQRFRPQGRARGDELVFVGTARGIARPSVVEPLRAGIPVSVYGPDWRGYIPASAVVATGIANSRLPGLYESAGAVLNDHWPAMRKHGFISNRLFDVVAAGGRAISDDVDGIATIFSGAVREYRSIPELLNMLRRPLDELFPSEAKLAEISARIRTEHSFDARARTLLDAALHARQSSR